MPLDKNIEPARVEGLVSQLNQANLDHAEKPADRNGGIAGAIDDAWGFVKDHKVETAAAVAVTAGLLHIWNHALMKGLMFLAADR